MSLEAYIWAANLPLSACNGTSHRVLLKLADRADPLGRGAFPSVASMAMDLECSERTVQRALRDLEDAALIRRGDQRFVAHFRDDRRPVVYDVLTAALVVIERLDGVTSMSPRSLDGVTEIVERGDNCCHPNRPKPTYQDSQEHSQVPAARETGMTE